MLNTGADSRCEAVRVVAAVIRRGDGAILLSLRSEHGDEGGLWEFPGGKLRRAERAVNGLARELKEELGIAIGGAAPLIRVQHSYPNKTVDLEAFEVQCWEGEPRGCEGQEIRWVDEGSIGGYQFPAANTAIEKALQLPRLGLITPELQQDPVDYIGRLEQCLDAGVRLVQLRMKSATEAAFRGVAKQAAVVCEQYGARLLLNGPSGVALVSGAHGVHLTTRRLMFLSERPLGADYLLSASCHNAVELQHAQALGVDFAYVSPVHDTRSHPGANVLGWHGLHRLVKRSGIPIFALGGMRAEDMRIAVRAGCQGIAMLRGVWDGEHPDRVVRTTLAAATGAAYAV